MNVINNTNKLWQFPFAPTAPTWSVDWPALISTFQWLRILGDCPQDPEYHAEGDVLTHTRMVCEAMIALPEWRTLDQQAQSILFTAALLHDVAKPYYTEVNSEGRVSSKGHVIKGSRMVRDILWNMHNEINLVVPFHIRETIVALIRHSGLPFFLFDKPDMTRSVIKASQLVRCDWLAILAEADLRGRICKDHHKILENIMLFREYCREQQCFDQPFQFASAHSRFIYFYKGGNDAHYHAFDDTKMEVVLMVGLPAAGKDEWIANNLNTWPVISLDALRTELKVPAHKNQGIIISTSKERAREYLRTQTNFIWNATNISRTRREPLISLFADYHARIKIVYVERDLSTIRDANHQREATVPANVIKKMADSLDIPDLTEAHEIIWAVED